MKNLSPQISVIMPAYNCAGTIEMAIESVLIQDVDLELIVINDQSPDNLDFVMEKYINDPRIIYVKNRENIGAAQSRNKGIALAKAPYIALLDSDDCWREGKLRKQLECLERTRTVLCATARELMDNGRILPVEEQISYESLLKHNSIACSSVVLATDVAREFPMEHEDSHEDYIAWMRIVKKYGPVSGINEPLLLYRVSTQGKSGTKLKSAVMTFRAYRYMGFGIIKSLRCFINYAYNGIKKYLL